MSFNQGHALLIGVGTHKNHAKLDKLITVADAEAVQTVLQNQDLCGYPAQQVTLLKKNTATKTNILNALDNLSQLQPTDTLFLFFAGHGGLGTDGNYYLLTHDVQISERRVQPGTGISESELLQKLNAIRADRLFMVFNACHSGHIAPETLATDDDELPETLNPSGHTANALLGTGQGRILIVASRPEQYSYIGKGETTIFTKALTDGLRGEASNNGGTISAFGLYEYLYNEVKETVEQNFGRKQEPMLTVIQGVGPFPIALYRGASTLSAFTDDSHILQDTAVQPISKQKAERSFNRKIDTGGGAYNEGIIDTGSGDFIGRDQTIYGDKIKVGDHSSAAIGQSATAVGERGVNVGGDVGDSVITGDKGQANSIQAHSIEAKNVVSGLQYITDPNQATPEQLRQELITLQTQLVEAIAAGEFENAADVADIQIELATVKEEFAKPQPQGSRIVRKLKIVAEILTESASTAQAAGKTGLAIIKLAPVAAALYQIATKMFAG